MPLDQQTADRVACIGGNNPVFIVFGLVEAVVTVQLPERAFNLPELVQVFEASLSAVVLIGAAIIFFITAETRVKLIPHVKSLERLAPGTCKSASEIARASICRARPCNNKCGRF